MRRFPWLVLLLALAAPLQAADVDDWLAKVGPALRGLDYQGTVVYLADGRVESMKVYHRRDDDGRERERIVAINGSHREVVRDGDRVVFIGDATGAVAYAAGGQGGWSGALALGDAARLRGYRASLGMLARIAGHDAQVIEVPARDGWRYGYRLWLEQRTGLPLRVDLLDAAGDPVEQVAFTELRIGVPPTDAQLRPSADTPGALTVAVPRPRQATPAVRWQVPTPPTGFRLRASRAVGEGVQLLYSDGLASVSVYVERAGRGTRGAASTRRGAVNARSYWVDGWRVLAIGKVPAATVDRFARTLRAVEADG